MKSLLSNIKIALNEKLYLKDPQSSSLGKRITEQSILLIDRIGFENFTFKKLGSAIGSNESSIYRYFENKHKLLLYLTCWYWGWLEYKLVFATNSISDPLEKTKAAIAIITETVKEDSDFSHINETVLSKIMVAEFSKSYLTKEVDKENKEGYYTIYKRIVNRLSEMFLQVNPSYRYAKSLASTVLEGALHQHYLTEHFVSITDCNKTVTPTVFFNHLVLTALKT